MEEPVPARRDSYQDWTDRLHLLWFLMWKCDMLPPSISVVFDHVKPSWRILMAGEYNLTSEQDFKFHQAIRILMERGLFEDCKGEIMRLIERDYRERTYL